MSINKVILLGNLGKDPEIRTMGNGEELATFSIATSDKWFDKKTNEKKERTEWHKIVCYSKGLVGIIKQYVYKGSQVYIEGSLQTRKWTDKQGVEKYTTEIIMQGYNCTLQMIGKANSVEGVKSNFPNAKVVKEENELVDERIDDSIPF